MKSLAFVNALDEVGFQAFKRKIELSEEELKEAGIEGINAKVLSIINTLIKEKNGITLSYQAEDMPIRAFIDRSPIGRNAQGEASFGWAKGKDFKPKV